MIFVTVGTDGPFDRLIKVVDRWAAENERDDIFAQIGEGAWKPEHVKWAELLDPTEFAKRFQEASVIIGHAGMGTILTALSSGKIILVMPKMASLGEHRNEHQMATARHLLDLDKVNVAFDEEELEEVLRRLDDLAVRDEVGPYAEKALTDGIKDFIHQG